MGVKCVVALVVIGLAVLWRIPRVAAEVPMTPVAEFTGVIEKKNPQEWYFTGPFGVSIGPADHVYVADDLAHQGVSACVRAGVAWGCFLTNDGVRALADPAFLAVLGSAARAAACEYSWHRYMEGAPCPAELGSQTVNSALMAEANRVISL